MVLGAESDSFDGRRCRIPKHLSTQIDNFSWDKIIEMSSQYSVQINDRRTELRKFEKQINLMHLILMEKIKDQHTDEHIEPQLFIDLIKLLEHSEKISNHYEIDLEDFNSFLYLIIQKIKKHKLAHIKHSKRKVTHKFKPMDENRANKIKKKKK